MQNKKIKKLNFLAIKILGFICLSSFIGVNAQQVFEEKAVPLGISYLESRNELEDYILDTGDVLRIEFNNTPDLSGSFPINEQGEIYLDRTKNTYVRGLTINELTDLLEERYKEFVINPEIYIRITRFKPIRVAVKGEVRNPGLIAFSAFNNNIWDPAMTNYELDTINDDHNIH